MTIKTGILAAAAALTLAIPAIASAQPYYGHDRGYAPSYESRRFEREREWRRAEEQRRWEWQRSHYRSYYGAPYGYYGR